MSKIFEPKQPIRVRDLSDINIDELLTETYTVTAIQSENNAGDGTLISVWYNLAILIYIFVYLTININFFFKYNLIPKGVLSLKVLQELPIIVLLMYQLYKQNLHQEVADFIPLIMSTIMLQPMPQHR